MSGPQYTVEQLIENIKRRCSVPTSQLTYTDRDFALLANDTLQGEVVPLIMSTREEFFVDFHDIPMPSDRIIEFPSDTVASKVRAVAYMQNTSPLTLINIPRVDLDVVTGIGFNNFNTLAGFYIQGNKLVFYPNTSIPAGTQIRIYYYKRTLVLTDPGSYGKIVSIDPNTNTIVLDFVPSTWGANTVLNAQKANTPFEISNEQMTITTVSAPSLILDNVTGLSVGDYVTEQGYAAIPQIPIEAHAYLAQLTAVKCLEGLGDIAGKESAAKNAELLKAGLLTMISQRVDGSVKKIVNPQGGLRLSSGMGRWGRGWTGGTW